MGKRKRSGSFTKTDESGAKRSDDCAEDSQEELDSENASGLAKINNATRCSARVQEKQEKLRRESSPSKQILPLEIPCLSTPNGAVANTSSKGNVKHPSPSADDIVGVSEPGLNLSNSVGLEEKRKKRNWELWSIEDKQLFFEALNEHGKDFDAIQNYLATKLKPRSKSAVCSQYASKNKDQVRHFYYRTWNKISKHLRFPSEMKKANQELYGLVNYGELRKKQRVLNSKSAIKLCEMVENGITSIKFRGKTCRIKTPVCRALKRLNGLDDIEHTRVPNKISLEFVPKDGKTWRSVQTLSHNPRVKVFVNLQRTLASVITFFEDKWKRKEDRLKEQFSSVFGKPRVQLRIIPIDKRELSIPLYKVAENASSATICLRSYTQNILVRERHDDTDTPNVKIKRKRKQSSVGAHIQNGSVNIDPNCNLLPAKRSDIADYCPADAENSDVETQFTGFRSGFSDPKITTGDAHPDADFRFPDEQSNEIAWMRFQQKWLDEEEQHDNMNSILFTPAEENQNNADVNNIATETDNDDLDHEVDDGMEKLCACGSGKVAQSEKFVSHVWSDEKAKRGWTTEEAGVMTIGEIYLMLGQAEKICFEYCWDTHEDDRENVRNHRLLERLIDVAKMLKRKKSTRSKASNSVGSSIPCGSCICSKCGKVDYSNVPTSKTSPHAVLQSTSLQNRDQSQIRNNLKLSVVVETPVSSSILPPDLNDAPLSTSSIAHNTTTFLQYFSSSPDIEFESAAANTITFNQADLESTDAGCTDTKSKTTISKDKAITLDLNQTKDSGPVSKPKHNISGGLIELCSLAGQDSSVINKHIAPNITATMLPASSSMVKTPNGTIAVTYAQNPPRNDKTGSEDIPDIGPDPQSTVISNHHSSTLSLPSATKEQITFHRPTLRPLEPALSTSGENQEFPPPKPFLDLPKGNRRIGRRPNYKRLVIPRVLLPKPSTGPMIPTVTVTTCNNLVGHTVALLETTASIIEGKELNASTTEPIVTTSRQPSTSTNNAVDNEMKTTKSVAPSKIFNEAFLGMLGSSSISCNSNDFQDLLKVRRHDSNLTNVSSGDMDNLSLSSFMEISLPESARMTANEINTDLRIEDLDSSNCSVNLSNLLNSGTKISQLKDLSTPGNSPRKQLPFSNSTGSVEGLTLSSLTNFENPWNLESGDMSLSNLFGQYDAARVNSGLPEGDVNFQTMINDGSLDFGMKLTELASPLSDNRK